MKKFIFILFNIAVFLHCSFASSSAYNQKLDALYGHWNFIFIISTTLFDYDYYLTDPYQSDDGDDYVSGTDEYGDPVLAGFSDDIGHYSLLDPSIMIDRFYVFDISSGVASGTYYAVDPVTSQFLYYYPFTGVNLGAATHSSTTTSIIHTSTTSSIYDAQDTTTTTSVSETPDTSTSTSSTAETTTTTTSITRVVEFLASPRSGNAPLVVQFTGLCEGDIKNYYLSFGDGTSVTGQSIDFTHLYAAAGQYSPVLTVTFSDDSVEKKAKENYITVYDSTPCPAETVLSDPDQLARLHSYRDNVLAQSAAGRRLIELYYKTAPSVSAWLNDHPEFKRLYKNCLELFLTLNP